MGKKKNAAKLAKSEAKRHPHLKHLTRIGELTAILNDPDAKKKTRKAARAELEQLRERGEKMSAEKNKPAEATAADIDERTPEQIDAEIRERLEAKRAARAAAADKPGSPERTSKMQADVAEAREKRHGKTMTPEDQASNPDPIAEDAAAETTQAVRGAADSGDMDAAQAAADTGVTAVEFANPSDAPKTDFDLNGLKQYKVKRPDDGKMVGYTRTTTYIDALEDKSTLTAWKMRILLEGVAAAETPDADGKADPVTARVRDLVHNRDLAIAKARKRDRKGKLGAGELATYIDGARSDFRRAMDKLADEIFELGGGREKAQKGTDLHALCELYDTDGMDAVQEKLDAGEILPSDYADVEAYADACQRLGLKVVAIEQTVVNDALKVAGRLDRIVLAKLPEIRDPKTGEVTRAADVRAKRYVLDVKTGRVDYGQGKIAQQLRMYADSQAYDLDTDERTPLGANKATGLLLHLPAGTGRAHVHVVDLTTGAAGNKLAGEVRAFRNAGRRAFNQKIDLVQMARDAETEQAAIDAAETEGSE